LIYVISFVMAAVIVFLTVKVCLLKKSAKKKKASRAGGWGESLFTANYLLFERPVDGLFSYRAQYLVRLGKMFTPEKSVRRGQRRRVRRGKFVMNGIRYDLPFVSRRRAPQQKNDGILPFVQLFQHVVGERFPPHTFMGKRNAAADGQDGV
jgi:hypothetical protein